MAKDTLIVFDLDDTIVKERQFLHSAYREIGKVLSSRYGDDAKTYVDAMIENEGREAFDVVYGKLVDKGCEKPLTPAEMVEIYRNHRPDRLEYAPGMKRLLDRIKTKGYRMALITDGRIGTQSAKIYALGLERYIDKDDMVISEATGHDKAEAYNFNLLVEKHPEATNFVYIGDNPQKDFYRPNTMGWNTVCILDAENKNIHPQDFHKIDKMYAPHHVINLKD